jgi:hypothetical protein
MPSEIDRRMSRYGFYVDRERVEPVEYNEQTFGNSTIQNAMNISPSNIVYTNSETTSTEQAIAKPGWHEKYVEEHYKYLNALEKISELEKQNKELQIEMSIMEKQLKEKLE